MHPALVGSRRSGVLPGGRPGRRRSDPVLGRSGTRVDRHQFALVLVGTDISCSVYSGRTEAAVDQWQREHGKEQS
jgi:hypothetical protein